MKRRRTGVTVVIESGGRRQGVVTDGNGVCVALDVRAGTATVTAQLAGFKTGRRVVAFTGDRRQVDLTLPSGSITETVTVTAQGPAVDSARGQRQENEAPSANVQNLQRRIAGVLPVRVDVPRPACRAGRPLVIDEESLVRFQYRGEVRRHKHPVPRYTCDGGMDQGHQRRRGSCSRRMAPRCCRFAAVLGTASPGRGGRRSGDVPEAPPPPRSGAS